MEKFFKSRGFYLSLAACLLAVLGMTTAAFWHASEKPGKRANVTTAKTTVTTAFAANTPAKNVPDKRTTTTVPTTATKSTDTVASTTVTVATPPSADLYILPLTNELLRPFSEKELLYSPTMKDWRTHTGNDFAGEAGQEVKAAADGTVSDLRTDKIWGTIIEIDHGSQIKTRYAGILPGKITIGQKVTVGESIGTLAEVPCEAADAPHLHFELLIKGKSVDPVTFIGLEVKTTASTADTTTTAAASPAAEE